MTALVLVVYLYHLEKIVMEILIQKFLIEIFVQTVRTVERQLMYLKFAVHIVKLHTEEFDE